MKNKEIQFPVRDHLKKKSAKTLVGIEEIEKQFDELKQELIRLQWYERVVELKQMQEQVSSMKMNYLNLDKNLFNRPEAE